MCVTHTHTQINIMIIMCLREEVWAGSQRFPRNLPLASPHSTPPMRVSYMPTLYCLLACPPTSTLYLACPTCTLCVTCPPYVCYISTICLLHMLHKCVTCPLPIILLHMLHNVTNGFYVPPRRWAAHCPACHPTQSRSWKMKHFMTLIKSQIILIWLFWHVSYDR